LRALAGDILSEVATPSSAPFLRKIIKAPSQRSSYAVEALGRALRGNVNKKAVDLLLPLAKHARLPLVLAAMEALAGLRDQRIPLFLQSRLSSASPEIQRAAILGIAAYGYKGATPLLRTFLDKTQSLAAAAALALADLQDRTSFATLLDLSFGNSPLAINASASLVILGKASDLPAIRPLLKHQNPLVRINAIAFLARVGNAQSKPLLTVSLTAIAQNDMRWLVRLSALRALAQLQLAPKLRANMAKNDVRQEVRDMGQASTHAITYSWKSFRSVDARNLPVSHATYFFVGADGVAKVQTSDKRGRMYFQQFPEGKHWQAPLHSLRAF